MTCTLNVLYYTLMTLFAGGVFAVLLMCPAAQTSATFHNIIIIIISQSNWLNWHVQKAQFLYHYLLKLNL